MMIRRATGKIAAFTKESGEEVNNERNAQVQEITLPEEILEEEPTTEVLESKEAK